MSIELSRNCPKCGGEIRYKRACAFQRAAQKGSGCLACREGRPKNTTPTEEKAIVADYLAEPTTATILAEKYEKHLQVILRVLRQHKVTLRSMSEIKTKYLVNTPFLDCIDTEEKAYFLGLAYADGSNNEKKKDFKIDLQDRDENVLIKLTNLIQPSKPLRYYKRETENHSDVVRFIVENKLFSERWAELGCVQSKTFKINYPDWLDPKLHKHFIRGYFDGDGHLNKKGQAMSFAGTESFCTRIQEIIAEQTGIDHHKLYTRHPERNHNIRSLVYVRREDVAKIADWLYNDSIIHLDRKHQTYLNLPHKRT